MEDHGTIEAIALRFEELGVECSVPQLYPEYAPDYYATQDWTDGCIAVTNADMVEIWMMTSDNVRIDIQPTDAPSLIVSISHVRADPSLTVGSMVAAGASKVGTVLDFSGVEHQALSHYTNDAGNHVLVEVHPSATLQAR